MSSPRRRVETDVMKLYVLRRRRSFALPSLTICRPHSMMTDHEVTLVKDCLVEFYVKFHGPKDSAFLHTAGHSVCRRLAVVVVRKRIGVGRGALQAVGILVVDELLVDSAAVACRPPSSFRYRRRRRASCNVVARTGR